MSEPHGTFDLPPKSVFEPPSYPNVWFYVYEALAASQARAVEFIIGWLHDHCSIVNDFGRYKPPEASDSQARLAALQPWMGSADPARNHAHDLHIRFYYIALRQQSLERVVLSADAVGLAGAFFRFSGSVHYEVEDEHPLHPSVDECSYCGRTGEYASVEDLFAGAHEPLGLEMLLYGTNHGASVARRDGHPVGGIQMMDATHEIRICRLSPARPDMNVTGLAVVAIMPKGSVGRR